MMPTLFLWIPARPMARQPAMKPVKCRKRQTSQVVLAAQGSIRTLGRAAFHRTGRRFASLLLWPILVSGCRPSAADPDGSIQPDWERIWSVILPADVRAREPDETDSREDEVILPSLSRIAYKPGHWVHVRHTLQCNSEDFTGTLRARAVDGSLHAIPLPGTQSYPSFVRGVALPQHQPKRVDLPFHVRGSDSQPTIQLEVSLHSRQGSEVLVDVIPLQRLEAHQYLLVVLATDPMRYAFLDSQPSIRPPRDSLDFNQNTNNYVVVRPTWEGPPPLPPNALCWTSLAYLWWDGVDPSEWSADQQRALVDWLHWGGTLIINAPRSLDRIAETWLADWLPADPGDTHEITPQQWQELQSQWLVSTPSQRLSAWQDSVRDQPVQAMALQPLDGGHGILGTGNLIVERQVGRGRIIVSGIDLADRRFVQWPGYDHLLHAALMRRPGRAFRRRPVGGDDTPSFGRQRATLEPLLFSSLRFFGRDASYAPEPSSAPGVIPPRIPAGQGPATAQTLGYQAKAPGGVASWNDQSQAALLAQAYLDREAGISIPSRGFLVVTLVGYIFCLVPLNWLLFRWLGRLEWAWFAAPAVAVVGALLVVKLARLDVGFVRSCTEVAILEMQPEYPRGHLTRFASLYTSLTSRYRVEFEDRHAQSLPWSESRPRHLSRWERHIDLKYGTRGKLTGLIVLSNSTGMLHTEQMADVSGRLSLQAIGPKRYSLTNGTSFPLYDPIVVGRNRTLRLGTLGAA